MIEKFPQFYSERLSLDPFYQKVGKSITFWRDVVDWAAGFNKPLTEPFLKYRFPFEFHFGGKSASKIHSQFC